MTSEVVVMNRLSVALAADSASTVTGPDGKEKIWNSANKLFALSRCQPVGVMFYRIDPQRTGISHSALLNNSGARELYLRNRDWRPGRARRARQITASDILLFPVKLDRNLDAARQRLAKLTKAELIVRLLTVEHAYSKLHGEAFYTQAQQLERDWANSTQDMALPFER